VVVVVNGWHVWQCCRGALEQDLWRWSRAGRGSGFGEWGGLTRGPGHERERPMGGTAQARVNG
jgi:hypothetical protein